MQKWCQMGLMLVVPFIHSMFWTCPGLSLEHVKAWHPIFFKWMIFRSCVIQTDPTQCFHYWFKSNQIKYYLCGSGSQKLLAFKNFTFSTDATPSTQRPSNPMKKKTFSIEFLKRKKKNAELHLRHPTVCDEQTSSKTQAGLQDDVKIDLIVSRAKVVG